MKKTKSAKAVICMAALVLGLMGAMTVTAAAATPDTSSSISGAIPTDGTGTVIENNIDTSAQREFFTIKTAAGNVFYIVVDKEKTGDNVYLLTQVTEADLEKLAGSKTASTITGGNAGSQSQTGLTSEAPATTSQVQGTTSTGKPAASGKKTQSGNIGTIVFVALAVLAAGGAGFYFKIYKPRREMDSAGDPDEMEPEDKEPETDTPDDDDGDE
jgi:cell division septation protein DedD